MDFNNTGRSGEQGGIDLTPLLDALACGPHLQSVEREFTGAKIDIF